MSGGHGAGGGTLPGVEVLAGLAHGLAQLSAVFLVGLGAFACLVLLPARAYVGVSKVGEGRLRAALWTLFGGLLLAGLVELPVYAVRASEETLSFGLLLEAALGTRFGVNWGLRLAAGALCALLLSAALARPSPARWGAGLAAGGALLFTFVRTSHAALEGELLPALSALAHVAAAAVWMGGLLGFPLVLLGGALGGLDPRDRESLVREAVRRFGPVATLAVAALLASGLYASAQRLPGPEALIETAYGRALLMKVGLLVGLLMAGAINHTDRGRGPFRRMALAELALALGVFVATGFLSTLPPPPG